MKFMRKRRSKGQGTVEYIIIVVLIAVASIAVIGAFSDRIKALFSGAAMAMGSEDASEKVGTSSVETLKTMDKDGGDLE